MSEQKNQDTSQRHCEGPIIAFRGVSKSYDSFRALENASFEIQEGEFVSIIGSSGAGKSTILKLLYAEEFPTEGEVCFGGRPTTAVKRRLLPYYRRNFGLVFQDFKLLSNKTAFENVAFAMEIDGWKKKEIIEEIPKLFEVVGLTGKENAYPHQLSGGENQRVSMARALANRPRVLIADEPTGNLDPVAADGIVDLLLRFNHFGATVVLATHNKDIVDRIARRVIIVRDGRIAGDEQQGKYRV
jgi:cell division transport system ATP-binding protein